MRQMCRSDEIFNNFNFVVFWCRAARPSLPARGSRCTVCVAFTQKEAFGIKSARKTNCENRKPHRHKTRQMRQMRNLDTTNQRLDSAFKYILLFGKLRGKSGVMN